MYVLHPSQLLQSFVILSLLQTFGSVFIQDLCFLAALLTRHLTLFADHFGPYIRRSRPI